VQDDKAELVATARARGQFIGACSIMFEVLYPAKMLL
jgi:hypothetical protein